MDYLTLPSQVRPDHLVRAYIRHQHRDETCANGPSNRLGRCLRAFDRVYHILPYRM